jgi:hypothetical protein
MSKLLINEPPIQVLPSLAIAIGLNEAIVLQQIHFWIEKGMGKEYKGERWVYNSIPDWQKKNFPFWSEATIKRTIASLKKQKLITSKNLNQKKYDRTLWYTIDYQKLESIETVIRSKCTDGKGQNAPMDDSKMTSPIPETTTETTTETTKNVAPATFAPPPFIHNKQKENQPENESALTPIQVDAFEKSSAAVPVAAAPSEKPAKQKKELSPHQQVMAAYQDALGYKIPNGAKEGVAAKKIVASEYTIEQMTGCYEKMKRDPFWRDKHLSLHSVYEQLGAYCQNGHGANGHKILDATAETARLNAHLPPL